MHGNVIKCSTITTEYEKLMRMLYKNLNKTCVQKQGYVYTKYKYNQTKGNDYGCRRCK